MTMVGDVRRGSTNDCVVCYIADQRFLLPSLISAKRVRRFVPPDRARIIIFTMDVDAAALQIARRHAAERRIELEPLPSILAALDKTRLAKTHTPLSTFGRFCLADALPASCKRIVYIDGDIWPEADIGDLCAVEAPDGSLAAVNDAIYFRSRLRLDWTSRDLQAYFNGLGLGQTDSYYNAGLFLCSRATLKDITKAALSFYLTNPDLCRNFDQSAMNAVSRGRRKVLSIRWNFQTQFKLWGADRLVQPALLHFNRQPKPWSGALHPWEDMFATYQAQRAGLDALAWTLPDVAPLTISESNAFARSTYGYLRHPAVAALARKAMGMRKAEAAAWF